MSQKMTIVVTSETGEVLGKWEGVDEYVLGFRSNNSLACNRRSFIENGNICELTDYIKSVCVYAPMIISTQQASKRLVATPVVGNLTIPRIIPH